MLRMSSTLAARPQAIAQWVLAALWQQKLRSALALSGVALGVAGCLIALAVGEGAKRGIVEQLEGMGLSNIYLRALPSGDAVTGDAARPLVFAHAAALEAVLDARIAPIARTGTTPVLIGVTDALPAVLDIDAAEGRLISATDMHETRDICVIPPEWAQADNLRLGGIASTALGACTVVGILRAGDVGTLRLALSLPQETMQIALVALPRLADAQRLPLAEARLSELIVGFPVAAAAESAPGWLGRNLRALGLERSVDLVSPAAQVRRALTARSILERLQLAFGLALLIVAGFGVMNLMLATVSERRSEIGLRRAVGATHAAILGQFLFEAIAICVMGGAIGLLSGLSGIAIASLVFGLPVGMSPGVIFLPLLSATAAGVLFGVVPAYRASQIEPLSALQGVS